MLCWGGPGRDRPPAEVVADLDDAIQVSVGRRGGCAVRRTGTVTCWDEPSAPVRLGGVDDGVQVTVSGEHRDNVCVRRRGGGVSCGVHDRSAEWQVAPVAGLRDIVQIGDQYNALDRAGRLWSFFETRPHRVRGPRPGTHLAADGFQRCILRPPGQPVCWAWGDLNDPEPMFSRDNEGEGIIEGIDDGIDIALGPRHHTACVVRRGGTVACWGSNYRGQLGTGRTGYLFGPQPVRGLTDAVQVTVGLRHACARTAHGGVACWGANEHGQLGVATPYQVLEPTPVANLHDAVDLAVGDAHGCALRRTGQVVCWGNNERQQLGDVTGAHAAAPRPVAGLGTAVQIAGSGSRTCARHDDGVVNCWSSKPRSKGLVQPVRSLTGATELVAGGGQVCGIYETGAAECAGRGAYGTMPPVRALYTNGRQLCRVDSAGGLACAGMSTRHFSEVTASGPPRDVDLGKEDLCVVDATGSVSCRAGRDPSPWRLAGGAEGLTGARQVAVGHRHACALVGTDEVQCWGVELGRDPRGRHPADVPGALRGRGSGCGQRLHLRAVRLG